MCLALRRSLLDNRRDKIGGVAERLPFGAVAFAVGGQIYGQAVKVALQSLDLRCPHPTAEAKRMEKDKAWCIGIAVLLNVKTHGVFFPSGMITEASVKRLRSGLGGKDMYWLIRLISALCKAARSASLR